MSLTRTARPAVRVIGTSVLLASVLLAVAFGILRAPQAAAANQWVYTGQLRTLVQTANVYGMSNGTQQYNLPATVVFHTPLAGERNPFSLLITTGNDQADGAVDIRSALTYQTGVRFQYWNLQWDSQTTFHGVLANNHTTEALAMNLINVPYEVAPHLTIPGYPVAMRNGTQMQGAFQNNVVYIRIIGNSTYGTNPFQVDVAAQFRP